MPLQPDNCPTIPCAGVVVIDDAAAVNKLKPRTSITVVQYRATKFATYNNYVPAHPHLTFGHCLACLQVYMSTSLEVSKNREECLQSCGAQLDSR